MSSVSHRVICCVAIAVAGAVALHAQPVESTRYRMVEGTVLTLVDPGGPSAQTPLHGTFDLVPSMVANRYDVEHFRGFDRSGLERVTGKGTYQLTWGNHQMVLDVLIYGTPHHLDSGMVPFGNGWPPTVEIKLVEEPAPAKHYILDLIGVPAYGVWFSSEVPFQSAAGARVISDGDLLTAFGAVLRTNRELTKKFMIMPPVPDIGLDAAHSGPATVTPGWEAWFSAEIDIFSGTGGLLKHGDFLSEAGKVIAREEELTIVLDPDPVPPEGLGLDAITWGWPCRGWYFSTEVNFWSRHMQDRVYHGDLLCAQDGWVAGRNADLLANFDPIGPVQPDYGLDAVYMWETGQIWFSTEDGFTDRKYGYVSDGDLLSMEGWVICRNADLIMRFGPLTIKDVGLDAVHVVPVERGDMSGDARINFDDIDPFVLALSNREGYYKLYPELNPDVVGDINRDGVMDFGDIDPFVKLLSGP